MRKSAVGLTFLLVAFGCGGSSDTATPVTTVAPAATQAPATTAATSTVPGVFGDAPVLKAIDRYLPKGQSCDSRIVDRGTPEDDEYGWEVGVDGYEKMATQILCDIQSEEFWFNHELRIQYPLNTGSPYGGQAETINILIRRQVATFIDDYFTRARGRYGDAVRRTNEQPRAPGATGHLFITGVVHIDTGSLYSVYLATEQNHPYANTTASPVAGINLDFATGEQFSLPDLFAPGSDWVASIADVVLREDEESIYPEMGSYMVPEFLSTIDFTMGPDSLVLHAQPYSIWFPGWCCGSSPKHFEIRYEDLVDVLDPDGPYRHILAL